MKSIRFIFIVKNFDRCDLSIYQLVKNKKNAILNLKNPSMRNKMPFHQIQMNKKPRGQPIHVKKEESVQLQKRRPSVRRNRDYSKKTTWTYELKAL